jgi:hypothetical protein
MMEIVSDDHKSGPKKFYISFSLEEIYINSNHTENWLYQRISGSILWKLEVTKTEGQFYQNQRVSRQILQKLKVVR